MMQLISEDKKNFSFNLVKKKKPKEFLLFLFLLLHLGFCLEIFVKF